MKRKLKVNDFFCGCGGMGIAFKNAGYEIAGAWDFDKYAVESYRANVGDHVQKNTPEALAGGNPPDDTKDQAAAKEKEIRSKIAALTIQHME